MAVEQTKRGVTPEEKKHKGACKECGAKFTYQGGDVQWMQGDRPADPADPYVPCPTCKKPVWVKAAKPIYHSSHNP